MEYTDKKLEDWVVNWFEENCLINKNEILENENANYFALGWMDSFKFISLISDIEENLNIEFSHDEFQDRTFATIKGLLSKLSEKKNAK